jgi:hypothetical protein
MIKLRKRPKFPEIRKVIEKVEVNLFPDPIEVKELDEDGTEKVVDCEDVPSPSLADVVRIYQDKGRDLSKVMPSYVDTCYKYDGCFYLYPKFSCTVLEPEEDYQKRLDQYKKDLKDYQKWYKENKDEIKSAKAEIKRKKNEENEERKLKNKKKRLKKQQEKISAELEKLK